ncbi:melanocyte-stimulating hormone receptor-like [Oculina patagonica]
MKKSVCDKLLEHFPLTTEYEDFFSTIIANCVFNSFLCYVAIVSNIVAIHAIRKTSSLPKPLKTLLVSLAVSDVGVGLLAHPLYNGLLVKWLQQSNPGCVIYKPFLVIMNFISAASFFGVVAISLDRFLAIHLHLRYQELVTHKRVVAVVISLWVLAALQSPLILFLESDTHHLFLASVGASGLLITAMVYIKMYLVLRRHRNDIQAFQVQPEAQDGSEIVNFSRLRKSALGTFYVYLAFLICYLPCSICLTAYVIFGPIMTLKKFFLYSWTLMFINSSLNPVIYCWKMRHIRRTIMDMLRNMAFHRN